MSPFRSTWERKRLEDAACASYRGLPRLTVYPVLGRLNTMLYVDRAGSAMEGSNA